MRKVCSVLMLLAMVVLPGCTRMLSTEKGSEQVAEQLFTALENKDADYLRKLLAPRLSRYVNNLSEQSENLIAFFNGEIVSRGSINGHSGEYGANHGKQTLLTVAPIIDNVRTESNTYRIVIYAQIIKSDSPDAEGIWQIEITNSEGETCELGGLPWILE